jgi:type IX secretion system substrate protein
MGVSVFATGGAELTENDVFFFVSQAGPPVPFNGATVTLTDGTFNESLITGADPLGDVFTGVPYGEYTYTIAKDCYETVTGTMIVDCANGMGVSVFATGGAELTANDVFFFIGSPLPLTGAIVTLTDGTFNEMIETGVDPLGDFFSEVPYGEYTYTISKDCYETITGTVTVACNGTMGVEVIENPVEIIIDNTVTVVDNVVTANATGLTYQWTTCDGVEISGETNQSFTPAVSGDYAVIITDGTCSITSECVTVTVVGISIEPSLNLSFYPNPVQTNLIIDLDERVGDVSVQVFNIHGQLMVSKVFAQNDSVELNLSKLFSGTYILKVTQKEETFRSPIIKL